MKRILIAAALIGLSSASHACTEGQRERLNANVERLFEQMNANGSAATGRAYMQKLQAYGECIAEMRTGNVTPLNSKAFDVAAAQYPKAVFHDHPIYIGPAYDPLKAQMDDCREALHETTLDPNDYTVDHDAYGNPMVRCSAHR